MLKNDTTEKGHHPTSKRGECMIISIHNLKKQYKKEWVLKGIHIEVKTPTIIALVGPNGSGKTTLLNCMTNLLGFSEGDIQLLGKKHTNPSIFKEVSYLQDNRILYGNLTGYDHLKFICDVQHIPHSQIKQVAEKIGMTSYLKKRVRNYSLGMKQHLLLAMSIINKPKLLLMDEPLTGLDPTSAITMRNVLLELHHQGTTIMLSSHNLDEIDRLTNTIYFMKSGLIMEESLAELHQKQYIVTVNNGEKAMRILKEHAIPYRFIQANQLSFVEMNLKLPHFIQKMSEHEVCIEDIDSYKTGAEQRYQELFEGVE